MNRTLLSCAASLAALATPPAFACDPLPEKAICHDVIVYGGGLWPEHGPGAGPRPRRAYRMIVTSLDDPLRWTLSDAVKAAGLGVSGEASAEPAAFVLLTGLATASNRADIREERAVVVMNVGGIEVVTLGRKGDEKGTAEAHLAEVARVVAAALKDAGER